MTNDDGGGAGPRAQILVSPARSLGARGDSRDVADAGDEARRLEELRRRIAYLAIASAAAAVAHHLAMYAAGVVQVEHALGEAKEAGALPDGWADKCSTLLARGAGRLMLFILLSLVIPMCGYYGVKRRDPRLVGCFCCSSAVFAMGSAVVVLMSCGAWVALQRLGPELEPWLQRCDPLQCTNLGSENRTVDCLAGFGRTTSFGDEIPHLWAQCPQTFLRCAPVAEDVDPDLCAVPEAVVDGTKCSDEARMIFCSPVGVAVDDGRNFASPGPLPLPGKCAFRVHFSKRCQEVEGDGGEIHCLPARLPTEPLNSCEIDAAKVEMYGDVVRAVPILIPKLAALAALKFVLTVPAVVIGLLGFWWGLALYTKLRAGYGVLRDPTSTQDPQNVATAGCIPIAAAGHFGGGAA